MFTATEAHPYAEAIAIKGTRILAVDTNQRISSIAGPNTRRIDLSGHVVIPGINDVHTHFGADFQGTMVDFGAPEPACTQVLELHLVLKIEFAPDTDDCKTRAKPVS